MNEELVLPLSASEVQFIIEPNTTPTTLKIDGADLIKFSKFLQSHPELYFDQLSCVTGLDNGAESKTMEVIYHFYSIPFHHSLAVKVVLPRENPEVESLSGLWKSANWMEREVYDMVGITFTHHPDLRRILMPADWEGHPLRKDYHEQETYRGISLK